MTKIKFSEIININDLKVMAQNLYDIASIQLGVIGVDGTVYVAVGWQEICVKYHRANKNSCEKCKKSDKYIENHMKEGTYCAYKCENNMWDVAMPIIISGEHVATVFVGQFFYEDEIIDEEYFRKQAEEFGFDEEGYIDALRKVPVLSRNRVNSLMEYYSGLVRTFVESGYRLLAYKESQEKLERSQKYLKTLLDSVNDIIIIFDAKGKVIDANETAIRTFGYPREKLLSMSRLDLMSKDSPYINTEAEKLVNRMKECSPLITEDIIVNKEGKEIWVEINQHFTTIDGEERVVSAIRDITERKQSELALINETIELDKLRTEFFANISHELRTPLNIIFSSNQNIARYLQDNTETIDRNKIVHNINIGKQNCFRLLRLINNLIDVTKMDSGLFELNLVNCNIVNIVEEITLSTVEYIETNDLTLVFDTDVEEKVIACDPDKIERIILNLLSNCIKFTDEGGHIYVNIIDGEEYITITVEDSGIGIPEEKLNTIFERFRQVDKSFTRNQEGSGIGLSLVKSLTEMQHGNISVESEYGKGTKFIIKLPIHMLEYNNDEKQVQHNNNCLNSFVERINIEFSDIYK